MAFKNLLLLNIPLILIIAYLALEEILGLLTGIDEEDENV